MDKNLIKVLNIMMEEQKKQTKILQAIASNLGEIKANDKSNIEFLINGTKL